MVSKMNIVTLLLSMLMIGCSISPKLPHYDDFRVAKRNFRYRKEADGLDDWQAFANIDRPFVGDCECNGFAFMVL